MRHLLLVCFSVVAAHAGLTYRVRVNDGNASKIITLDSEAYIAGVLGGEASDFKSDEALKAMAVSARTYAANGKSRHEREGFDFCSTTHCQRFQFGKIPERLSRAVQATDGQLLWFEGNPAFAVYSRDCGGSTEHVHYVWPESQVPYLPLHNDPYCVRHGVENWDWTAQASQVSSALREAGLQCPEPLVQVTIIARTASQRARTLQLSGPERSVPISASSFRFALGRALGWNGMRSERYEVTVHGGVLHFHGSGQGHGVGLCQKGAEEMGIEGLTYREILAFYYPGTSLGTHPTNLRWTKLSGERVTVLTTTPDHDKKVVALAEQLSRQAGDRLELQSLHEITVRVYPTVEVFRNATAEPGWVAARTSGSIIDLQPIEVLEKRRVLRSTLYHEFLHISIESEAVAGLPVWFREGLTECLSGELSTASAPEIVTDQALRQRDDQRIARDAYAAATTQVARMVATYGEATVVGWLRTGLPREVKNSTANSPLTKSR